MRSVVLSLVGLLGGGVGPPLFCSGCSGSQMWADVSGSDTRLPVEPLELPSGLVDIRSVIHSPQFTGWGYLTQQKLVMSE